MTIEEKLALFAKQSITRSEEEHTKELSDYQAELDKAFEDFKIKTDEKYANLLEEKKEQLKRNSNSALSTGSWEERHKISKRKEELRVELFSELTNKLIEFKKEDAYLDKLVEYVEDVKKVADGNKIIIYLSSGDDRLKDELKRKTDLDVETSDIDFVGGIRAIIPDLNIMVDKSFLTAIEAEKNSFDTEKIKEV